MGYATRAYLLMLVGSTIFADKTSTLVEARYLSLFIDLDGLSGYSWGAAALVTLYIYLIDASMFSCKQLGGYPPLLQCWIHEYFPTLGKKRENWIPASNVGLPRAMRWSYRQGALKVDDLRPILDELTPSDVIWRPFENHRVFVGNIGISCCQCCRRPANPSIQDVAAGERNFFQSTVTGGNGNPSFLFT
ncbi:unnamed protein product [Lathyrus sativus]|nr:unnamed protein product [Lathyrus sativus]